jgi:glutamate-5-semialdehyde dehydrogenase
MPSAIAGLEARGRAAKAAVHRLAYLSTDIKNQALHNICQEVLARSDEILTANQRDYRAAEASGMSAYMLDRLMLNSSRLEGIAQDMLAIAALPDPVGEVFDMRTGSSGLQIGRARRQGGHLFQLRPG